MINIGPTIPVSNSDKLVTRKVADKTVADVKPSSDKRKRSDVQFEDRRKNKDRRRNNAKGHLLESRAGRDRRKNAESNRPSIDIEA
ncbi:hypothetical protein NBRC116493_34970 [Aurantivibrio infirmus]